MKRNKKDSLVYKFYNKQSKCIYVGITTCPKLRFKQHERSKDWFSQVKDIEVSNYMNRNVAHIYEIYYISILKPKYNGDFMKTTEGFDLTLKDLQFEKYDLNEPKIKDNKRDIYEENYLRRKAEIMEMEDCSYRQIELNNSYSVSPFHRKEVFDRIGGLNGALICMTMINYNCQMNTTFNFKDKNGRYIYCVDLDALKAHISPKKLKKLEEVNFFKNIKIEDVDEEILSKIIKHTGKKDLKYYYTVTDFRKGDIDRAVEILSKEK